MTTWHRYSICVLVTAFVAASSYVSLVAVLNQGNELGDPIWEGLLIQIVFHAALTLVALAVVVTPVFGITIRAPENGAVPRAMLYSSIFIVLLVLYSFVLSGLWAGVLVPGIFGVLTFYALESRTDKPGGRRTSP